MELRAAGARRSSGRDDEDVGEGVVAEGGGDGGGEAGEDDEGGLVAPRGDELAQLDAGEEMALPESREYPNLTSCH